MFVGSQLCVVLDNAAGRSPLPQRFEICPSDCVEAWGADGQIQARADVINLGSGVVACEEGRTMEVLFVTGFSPIVSDRHASREFYRDGLQLPLDHEECEYVFADTLPGVKH